MDAFNSIVLLTDMFLKGLEQQWNSHQINALCQISDIVLFFTGDFFFTISNI